MAETIMDVYIKSGQLVLIGLIFIFLARRRYKYRIKSLNWMIWVFALAFIQGIVELVIYYVKIYVLELGENADHFRFNEYHSIPYSIAIFVIYLFSEAMNGHKPNMFRFSIIIALWTSYLTLLLRDTFLNYSLTFDTAASVRLSKTIFDIFTVTSMLFTSIVFFKAYRSSKNVKNRRGALLIFVSTLTYVLAGTYEIGEDIFDFPPVYGAITFSVTFIVLAYMYTRYPYFVFTVPSTIYRLMVSSEHGIYLYSVDMDSEEEHTDSPDELLSSAINSIAKFVEEETGSEKYLRFISLIDRAIVIYRGKSVSGIMITDNSTRILYRALSQFIDEFEETFETELGVFSADISRFDLSKNLVLRCFPYIESEDVIKLTYQQDSLLIK